MKGINTVVLRDRLPHLFALSVLIGASVSGWSDDKVTRIYMLKNMEVSNISRVINIAVRDPDKTRVVAGQGKRLVITDTPDQQDAIAQLLPVLDQPLTETDPDKIQMRMLMNASQYLRQQKIATKPAPSGPAAGPGPAAPAPTPVTVQTPTGAAPAAHPDDKFKPATPYKSVYASDDAELTKGPRIIKNEPVVLSLGGLQLKGIFRASTQSPLALLSFDGTNYTAHDGGLFENNHFQVKNVTSKVLKDRVILTGQDRIPHEIKFKTSL